MEKVIHQTVRVAFRSLPDTLRGTIKGGIKPGAGALTQSEAADLAAGTLGDRGLRRGNNSASADNSVLFDETRRMGARISVDGRNSLVSGQKGSGGFRP